MDIYKKKQKNVEPRSPNSDIEGDAWLFSFIMRGSYLIVASEIGKRTRESCKRLFEKVFYRVLFSDGNEDYTSTIPEYYAETCVDYGQLIKIREGGKVVDKIKKVIYGTPCIDEIETTDIENMNMVFAAKDWADLLEKQNAFRKRKHDS